MKFFVIFLVIGFAATLHAYEEYPGYNSRPVYEHEKNDEEVGTGYNTSGPCCTPGEMNQQYLNGQHGVLTPTTQSSSTRSSQ